MINVFLLNVHDFTRTIQERIEGFRNCLAILLDVFLEFCCSSITSGCNLLFI